jgi:hypothetical protein
MAVDIPCARGDAVKRELMFRAESSGRREKGFERFAPTSAVAKRLG